jgi:hypothetical protein
MSAKIHIPPPLPPNIPPSFATAEMSDKEYPLSIVFTPFIKNIYLLLQ